MRNARIQEHGDSTRIKPENLFKVFSHQHVWAPPLALTVFLGAVSTYSYLLFHTLAELFAVMVALLIYVVAWQTYRFSRNGLLIFLACGYFWIGALDLIHALVYKGMNIFPIITVNPSAQLWISARYYEAFLLLAAPLFLTRPINRRIAFTGFGLVAVIVYSLVMYGFFPDAFIEGQGLTKFKIYSEYVIIALLIGALAHMVRRRALMELNVLFLLGGSIVLTMGAELAFTYYVSAYGLSNLGGHIFKIFSYWLLFIAIIRTTLLKPYFELEEEIGERKKIESALKESELRLDTILNTAPEAIITINHDGIILVFSRGAERIFGYESKDVIGRSLDMLIPESVRNNHRSHIEEFSRSKDQYRLMDKRNEIAGLRKNGTEFPASASVTSLEIKGKKIFTVMLHDITESKRAEEQMIQSNKLATLGEVTTGMAHELNQPLNITHMAAESLLEMVNDGDVPTKVLTDKLERILSQVDRAAAIINHMRMFGRTDTVKLEAVDLTSVIQGATGLIKEQLRLSETELLVDLPETYRKAMGQHLQLEQVVLNLLTNARDAIKVHSTDGNKLRRITISITDDPGSEEVSLSVSDTGGGVPDEILDHIFEPFFTTKDVGKGTGLGLSISYSIISDMGGRIEAANIDDGAKFTIVLSTANEASQQVSP